MDKLMVDDWDDKAIKTFCREFRKGMLDRMSSNGKCAMVSWALQGILSSFGLKTKVYESEVNMEDEICTNHLWLRMPDGRVLDCTADQFGKKYPKIYLGKPLDIHTGGKPYAASR